MICRETRVTAVALEHDPDSAITMVKQSFNLRVMQTTNVRGILHVVPVVLSTWCMFTWEIKRFLLN